MCSPVFPGVSILWGWALVQDVLPATQVELLRGFLFCRAGPWSGTTVDYTGSISTLAEGPARVASVSDLRTSHNDASQYNGNPSKCAAPGPPKKGPHR